MIFSPEFEIKDMNSRLLKDILLNVKRLVVKDYIKTQTFKKVVSLLRVAQSNEKSMNQVRKETPTEMKFGDLLEEFIFLVFKYQRRSKGIDYFQSCEEEEPPREKPNGNDNETLKDKVELYSAPKLVQHKTLEQHYEMSTVVEESNEDEGEDSPLNKKLPSPAKTMRDETGSPASVSASSDIHPLRQKLRYSVGNEDQPVNELLSPSKVPTNDLPPAFLPCFKKNIDPHRIVKEKKVESAKKAEPSKKAEPPKKIETPKKPELPDLSDELVKIENLIATPTDKSKHSQRQDSKVSIIERLESKIFKLLRDTKKQIEKSKDKKPGGRNISLPGKSPKRNPSYSREKDKSNKKLGNISMEIKKTPEKMTAMKLIQGKVCITRVKADKTTARRRQEAASCDKEDWVKIDDMQRDAAEAYVDNHFKAIREKQYLGLVQPRPVEADQYKRRD